MHESPSHQILPSVALNVQSCLFNIHKDWYLFPLSPPGFDRPMWSGGDSQAASRCEPSGMSGVRGA